MIRSVRYYGECGSGAVFYWPVCEERSADYSFPYLCMAFAGAGASCYTNVEKTEEEYCPKYDGWETCFTTYDQGKNIILCLLGGRIATLIIIRLRIISYNYCVGEFSTLLMIRIRILSFN